MPDRYALVDIAERIASTENRVHHLRYRVFRLKEQGSDAQREEEILQSLNANLGELYSRQSTIRRASWVRL